MGYCLDSTLITGGGEGKRAGWVKSAARREADIIISFGGVYVYVMCGLVACVGGVCVLG